MSGLLQEHVPRRDRFARRPAQSAVWRVSALRAEAWRPRFLLIENVAEMKRGFEGAYTDSADGNAGIEKFWAIMSRITALTPRNMACRKSVAARFFWPRGTTSGFACRNRRTATKMRQNRPCVRSVTVWDALSDLPDFGTQRGNAKFASYATSAPERISGVGQTAAVANVRNHIAKQIAAERSPPALPSLLPGQGLKDLPDELRPKSGYSGAYGRLDERDAGPNDYALGISSRFRALRASGSAPRYHHPRSGAFAGIPRLVPFHRNLHPAKSPNRKRRAAIAGGNNREGSDER